jgi:hypothetical protein
MERNASDLLLLNFFKIKKGWLSNCKVPLTCGWDLTRVIRSCMKFMCEK